MVRERLRRGIDWWNDVVRSGHSMRRQLVLLVAAATVVAGLVFNVFGYLRERDFMLDALEEIVVTQVERELLRPGRNPAAATVGEPGGDEFLQLDYVEWQAVAGQPPRRIQRETDVEIPALERLRELRRRDLLRGGAQPDAANFRLLRQNRFWHNTVAFHLAGRRADGTLLRAGYSVHGLDTHLMLSYVRNAFWILIEAALAALVVYLLLSAWLVAFVRAFLQRFRQLERGAVPDAFEVRDNDELGELHASFNRMAAELQASHRLRRELEGERMNRAFEAEVYRETLHQTSVENTRQRFESLGRLSAGIAHEINNPLNFIRGALPPLRRKLAPLMADREAAETAAIEELLGVVDSGVARATQIVADMRRLVSGSGVVSDVDLGESVEQALRLTRWMVGADRQVTRDLAAGVVVYAPSGLLVQVWANLIANAVEATGAGGRIVVAVRADDGAAVVTVDDDGPGIAAAAREMIFEPFMTTKEQGTGLGLATVRSILDDLGATIVVADSDLGGARFVVTMPRVAGSGTEAP